MLCFMLLSVWGKKHCINTLIAIMFTVWKITNRDIPGKMLLKLLAQEKKGTNEKEKATYCD